MSPLLDALKISMDVAAGMSRWRHAASSVDDSARLEAGDREGMLRMIEYCARCPFSLARMITVTGDGRILCRASHPTCLPFPLSGDTSLLAGIPRNF